MKLTENDLTIDKLQENEWNNLWSSMTVNR